MQDFFKPAGDLEKKIEELKNKTEDENKYFQTAGDLDDEALAEKIEPQNEKNKDTFLKLNQKHGKNILEQEKINSINKYIDSIVTGKFYEYESELGTLIGGGYILVTLAELKQMAEDDSYNIIKAICLNSKVIAVEYQQFEKENSIQFQKNPKL